MTNRPIDASKYSHKDFVTVVKLIISKENNSKHASADRELFGGMDKLSRIVFQLTILSGDRIGNTKKGILKETLAQTANFSHFLIVYHNR